MKERKSWKSLIVVALLFTTSVLAQDVPLQRVKPQKPVAASVSPEVQASIDELKAEIAELKASIEELKVGLATVQAQAKAPAAVVPAAPPELQVGHSFVTGGLIGMASERKKEQKWCAVHPDGLIPTLTLRQSPARK